jgi:NADP-dependent 3-hydroxy acid dehydrogenase YdfG
MDNVNQAEFEGKVAIVTGAASGIGRAKAAEMYADQTTGKIRFENETILIVGSK